MKRPGITIITSLLLMALVWLLLGREVMFTLLTGFPAHIARVWPQLTWNIDLLVPFVVAYALAVGTGHGLVHRPMKRRGVRWRMDHTLCIAGFVPLLFATAFLVPGILLHAQLLIEALD